MRTHWEAVRLIARLHGVRFYDLRHTVASELLRRGATMRDLQRLLGHTTARMTERYAHFAKNLTALDGVTWGHERGTSSGTPTWREDVVGEDPRVLPEPPKVQ